METLQQRIEKIKWLRNLCKQTSPKFYDFYKSYKLKNIKRGILQTGTDSFSDEGSRVKRDNTPGPTTTHLNSSLPL